MLNTRSYRIGTNPDLREINDRLGLLRPFQVKGFYVSNRRSEDGELILLHDEREAPQLIEMHPPFGSIISVTAGPDHFLLLFDIPVAQADLELNGVSVIGEITGDFVRIPIGDTGENTGEFILTGRVKSKTDVWSDSDCLSAYSLASTAPHSGSERPNHLDDGKLKCVNMSIDGRNTARDIHNLALKRKNVKADEIIEYAKERRPDLVDNIFMIHRSPAPPNLVRIYPGHGASLPLGGSYHIAAAFDRKLAPTNWGSIFVNDVDRTSAVTLHENEYSLILPIIETTGTHSIRFENLKAKSGETRKFAIISSFTIMPIEWSGGGGSTDLSNYYTKPQTNALFLPYYTAAEINVLLQNYYTQLEVDNLITAAIISHSSSSDHDGRYYTETEIDTNFQPLNPYLTDISTITPATGGLIYFDGTDYIQLGIGTLGKVVTASGSPVIPSWETPSINAVNVSLNTGNFNRFLYDGITDVQLMADRIDDEVPYSHPYEPNGFLFPGGESPDTTLTWDDSAGTITLSPTGADFIYYSEGLEFISTGIVISMTTTEGIHWVYIDKDENVIVTDGEPAGPEIERYCLVCQYYWDTTNSVSIIRGDERHGIQMSGATHRYLHETVGTVWEEGLAINGYTLQTDTDNAIRLGWSVGEIHDEDIDFDIIAGTHPSTIPVFYRFGVSNWRRKTVDTYPFIQPGVTNYPVGTYIAYNDENGGNWDLTDIGNNNYVTMWICATTDLFYPIIAIPSQSFTGTLSNAQDQQFGDLNLTGLPFPELKVIWKVIYRCRSIYSSTAKSRIEDVTDFRATQLLGSSGYTPVDHGSLSGLSTSGHPADIIAVDPTSFTGILSGTDIEVQEALDTIDDHIHDDRYYTETEIDALVLNDISDVLAPSPSSGDFVYYDGVSWIPRATAPGSPSDLDDLLNVIVPAPTSGDVLTFDGVNWVDEPYPLSHLEIIVKSGSDFLTSELNDIVAPANQNQMGWREDNQTLQVHSSGTIYVTTFT